MEQARREMMENTTKELVKEAMITNYNVLSESSFGLRWWKKLWTSSKYIEKATCMHVGNGQWGEKRSKVSNLAALTRFLQGLLFRVNSICVATLKASWLDTKIKHAWQPTTPRAYQKEKNMREIMGGDFDLHVSKNKCILISLSFHIEKVSLTNKRMPS